MLLRCRKMVEFSIRLRRTLPLHHAARFGHVLLNTADVIFQSHLRTNAEGPRVLRNGTSQRPSLNSNSPIHRLFHCDIRQLSSDLVLIASMSCNVASRRCLRRGPTTIWAKPPGLRLRALACRCHVVCNAVIESSKPRCKFATCSDTRSNPGFSSWNTQKLLELNPRREQEFDHGCD